MAERTVTLSNRTLSVATPGASYILFPTPYDVAPNQPIGIVAKPGASNATIYSRSVPTTNDADADSGGESCFAISRSTGGFTPNQFERYTLGALMSGFAHPARSSHILGL